MAIAHVPAAVIVLVITGLLIAGTRKSVKLNNVMVVVKLVVVLAFVLVGAAYVNTANWHPYIPPNTGEFGQFGISGVLRGASIVFFAYIGFDAVSNCAQEARQPQRDMPIGILGSLAICDRALHRRRRGADRAGALSQAQRAPIPSSRARAPSACRGCRCWSRSVRWSGSPP